MYASLQRRTSIDHLWLPAARLLPANKSNRVRAALKNTGATAQTLVE
jgi:hypothetical protein